MSELGQGQCVKYNFNITEFVGFIVWIVLLMHRH